MSEIPDDIRETAWDLIVEHELSLEVRDAIAAALMAERQRCAKIADAAKEMRQRLYDENGAVINAHKAVQAEMIAADIRRGTA